MQVSQIQTESAFNHFQICQHFGFRVDGPRSVVPCNIVVPLPFGIEVIEALNNPLGAHRDLPFFVIFVMITVWFPRFDNASYEIPTFLRHTVNSLSFVRELQALLH